MSQKTDKDLNKSLFIFPRPYKNAKLRVFCFHYAGGGASIYKNWVDFMPLEVELCLIQLPGRENRRDEKAYRTFTLMVKELAAEISPLLDKTYIFFGHSMGALISFELVRKLKESGKKLPIHIFLSGLAPPKNKKKSRLVNTMSDSEIINMLTELNGTPKEVLEDKKLLDYFLPVIKADFELLQSYSFIDKGPLPCPITSYAGENDKTSLQDINAWEKYTINKFQLKIFQGDHFFINSARNEVLSAFRLELRGIINDINELSELISFNNFINNVDSESFIEKGMSRGQKQRILINNIKKVTNL